MSTLWPLRRLQVELVNVCNFRCPLCRTLEKDGVTRRRMSVEEFRRVVGPVRGEVTWLALYGTRGEPFLHPELEEVVAAAVRMTGAHVVVSTNGSLVAEGRAGKLLDSGLSEIIFAVDGLTQQSYEKYRVNGDLESVLANVRAFCAAKRRGGYETHVVFQFIPMSSNEHEVARVESFGRELGVDEVRLKLSSSVAGSEAFRPAADSLRPARGGAPAEFDCPNGLDFLYVDPNGDCFPCCYAEGHARMSAGNCLKESTAAIWDGAALWELRRSFAEQSRFHPFCVETCQGTARRTRRVLYSIGGVPPRPASRADRPGQSGR